MGRHHNTKSHRRQGGYDVAAAAAAAAPDAPAQTDAHGRSHGRRQHKKDAARRKQEEKYWQSKYAADADEEDRRLEAQLSYMGLHIRDTRGDGNCLFRALSDQRTGSDKSHGQVRQQVVDFMRANKADFAPFVPEDLGFEDYLDLLATPGEYAGNDALVAYARAAHVDIYVHQVDKPVWIIRAVDGRIMDDQVHLAYQSYEHYSSVRHANESNSDSSGSANVVFEALDAPRMLIKVPAKAPQEDDDADKPLLLSPTQASASASDLRSAAPQRGGGAKHKTHKSSREKEAAKRERKKRKELEKQAEAKAKAQQDNNSAADGVAESVASLTI